MPVFKSPFSSRSHKVVDYDMDDYILNNSKTEEKVDTQFNNDLLTTGGWNLDHNSTRKKVYRDVVLDKEQIHKRAKRHSQRILRPRKWRNW